MTNFLYTIASIKMNAGVTAQAVHTLIGYGAMLTAYRVGVRRKTWKIAAAVLVFAFGIEIFYDPVYENAPFFFDGLRDTCFYALGAVIGFGVDRLDV